MGGKSSSAPPPDPELIKAHIKSLGVQDSATQRMMSNAEELLPFQREQLKYGLDLQKRLSPLQEEQMRFSLKAANTAYDQSQEDRQWALMKRGQLDQAQRGLLDEATNFNEGQRRDTMFGEAVGDITQAFDQAEAQGLRTMSRMGVNPNDARMGAMVNQNNLQEALAKATAGRKVAEAARAEGLQLKSNAANMLSGYPSMGMSASSNGAGFGGMGLTIANNGLAGAGAGMNFMNAGLAGMNSGFGAASQMAGGMGSSATNMFGAQASYKNTQDQIAAASDPFNTILGAAAGVGTGVALKSMGFSDLRLKESITAAGTDERTGLPLYEFEYKGGTGKRFRGVMAQDVMHVDPEAVFVMPDGFMAVDYSRLGMEMVEV